MRPLFPYLYDLTSRRSDWLCLVFTVLLVLSPRAQSQEKEAVESAALVPAAFGIWTDRTGSPWSVEAAGNIGRIGSTMVNSGLALLVDDEKFEPYRPMMTPDGKELILRGLPMETYPGLQVQRRIRMLDDPGGLRYAELFLNSSADTLTFSVALTTNFSGNFKTFLSDHSRSEPLFLGPRETAVVVLPGASQSSRAFLFTLAGSAGGVRPTISSQNRYGIVFRFRVDLAPGQTAVVVHHVAQIAIPQTLDRRSLLKATQPFGLDALRAKFDPDWLPYIVNSLPASGTTPRMALAKGSVSSLGVSPSASAVLAMGEGSRLTGTFEGGALSFSSVYGEAKFPIETIAAITGAGRDGKGESRLYLRDGQILSGKILPGSYRFQPTEGDAIDLDLTKLDRLIFPEVTELTKWPDGMDALLEMRNGDRIQIASPGEEKPIFHLATGWGTLAVSLSDLIWMYPASMMGGHRVLLQNGTNCEGFLSEASLPITSAIFGETQVPAMEMSYLYTAASWAMKEGDSIEFSPSSITLVGQQTLAGTVANESLSIQTEAGVIATPVGEIRRVERTGWSVGAPHVRLTRWDQGVVTGFLTQSVVEVDVAGTKWEIPSRDVARMDLPSPKLTADATAAIQAWISALGAEEWGQREQATKELTAFGHLAHSALRSELAKTGDPEVIHRIEGILAETR